MKIWLITGASRGFGARVATRVLAKGDAVVATARHPRAVAERLPLGSDTVAAIEAKHGANRAILDAWRSVAISIDFAEG